MKTIRPPFIGMSGVELGSGLFQLAHQLLDDSVQLMAVDPNDAGLKKEGVDRIRDALWSGEHRLPTIRARLHRYAALVVAKQYPDLEMPIADTDEGVHDRRYSIANALSQAKGKPTPVWAARGILGMCQELVERKDDARVGDGERMEAISHQLDIALEIHSHLCSMLWVQLDDRFRELSERTD